MLVGFISIQISSLASLMAQWIIVSPSSSLHHGKLQNPSKKLVPFLFIKSTLLLTISIMCTAIGSLQSILKVKKVKIILYL